MLYERAGRLIASRRRIAGRRIPPWCAALVADEELPEGLDFKGVMHLVAAIGVRAQEVGG